MHKINCTCAICLGAGVEPTWWHLVALVVLVATGLTMAWLGLQGPLW